MLIGKLAEKTGLSKDTLRFYEKEGLLKVRKMGNGYKDYPHDLLPQIEFIRLGKEMGFSLKEIKDLQDKIFAGNVNRSQVRQFLQSKQMEIEEKIRSLQKMRRMIITKLESCLQSDLETKADVVCPEFKNKINRHD